MPQLDYWKECLAIAAEECGLSLSDEHLTGLAEGAMGGHEHYGMAFYSPPCSDRISVIENEWKAKYEALQKEFDRYRNGAEKAVKTALRQYPDTNVSITNDGEVFRHCGRTEQIL